MSPMMLLVGAWSIYWMGRLTKNEAAYPVGAALLIMALAIEVGK